MIPLLTPGILIKIVNYSLSYDDEPDYSGWFNSRLVSRSFKEVTEDFFVRHYLKYTWVVYDWDYYGRECSFSVNIDAGNFDYKELEAPRSNIAVFTSRSFPTLCRSLPSKVHRAIETNSGGTSQGARGSDEDGVEWTLGYSLQSGRYFSDIVPVDMKIELGNAERPAVLTIDWQKTYTLYMADWRYIIEGRKKTVITKNPAIHDRCR